MATWWLSDTVNIDCQPWGSEGGANSKQVEGLSPNGEDDIRLFMEW